MADLTIRRFPMIFVFLIALCEPLWAESIVFTPQSPSLVRPRASSFSSSSSARTDSSQVFSLPSAVLSLALDLTSPAAKDSSSASRGNAVLSPLSISSALSMLLLGTGGNTYTQLREALGFHANADDSDIHSAYQVVLNRLANQGSGVDSNGLILRIANGLFVQQSATVKPDYLKQTTEYYNSEISQVDFKNNPFGATSSINSWVASKTKNKITNMLSTPLPRSTELVLGNAVYFNGAWSDPFEKDITKMENFYVADSEIMRVPIMAKIIEVPYAESTELGAKIIGIPYKGEEMGLFMIVPLEDKVGEAGLKRVESKLTVEALESLIDSMEAKTVSVRIPRFRIEQKLFLKQSLQNLGVTDLFTSQANLGRMTEAGSGMALDNVIHQTVIEVTETGTEAAAATLISISRDGPSKVFEANQPFLFALRDIRSKVILFWGRVVRPESPRGL